MGRSRCYFSSSCHFLFYRLNKFEWNQKVILFTLLIYCINRFCLKRVIDLPVVGYILRCHFNDYLGGICIIAYINLVLMHSKYKYACIQKFSTAIIVTAICGVLWEYIMPALYRHSVSDFADVISYMTGGITYFVINKIHVSKKMCR